MGREKKAKDTQKWPATATYSADHGAMLLVDLTSVCCDTLQWDAGGR